MVTKPARMDNATINRGRTPVFVFGGNAAGRHGKGAALTAYQHHGAVYGVGYGRQGNSYALRTKNDSLQTLSLQDIGDDVDLFLFYAAQHPECVFWVTRVGCGLAKLTDSDMAPLFANAPENVILPKAWGGEGFEE